MKNTLRLSLLAAFVAANMAVASAQVVWSQPNDSADGYFSDGISTNGTQFYAQAIADNFTLASATTISLVRFWGSSENFVFADLDNFSAWDIYVMDASFNTVASAQIAKASMTITATGNQNTGLGNEYMMEASTNFNLGAGSYWLHIGSVNIAPGDDGWVWSSSNTGDVAVAANFFDGNGWAAFPGAGDEAFELEGQPVPEPASMVALGLGAVALLRRRKKA